MTKEDQWNLDQQRKVGVRVRYWLKTGKGSTPGSLEWRRRFGWRPILTEAWLENYGKHIL